MIEKKFVAQKAMLMSPQGRILFVRDAGKSDHSHAKGTWDVPGGRMDAGETPLETLAREVREEVGVEIDPERARPFHIDRWGVMGDVENQPIIGTFFLVRVDSEEIDLGEEHDEVWWWDPRLSYDPDAFKSTIPTAIEALRRTEGILPIDEEIKGFQGYGLVQVISGNGKGKTTAALGQAVRAAGAGKRVGIVYFDKGGDSHYSERAMLDTTLSERIAYVATGRDRIDPVTGRFDFSIQEVDRTEARRGLDAVRTMFQEGRDLVVLDEINSTTDLGMLSEEDVLTLLREKPERTEVILTGRNVPESFLGLAHLYTEMKLHKHYFYSGVKAREGLDY